MKSSRIVIVITAVLVLIAVIAISFLNKDTRGENQVESNGELPLIDTTRPAVVKTATFAMG
jgi:hypothetical protein